VRKTDRALGVLKSKEESRMRKAERTPEELAAERALAKVEVLTTIGSDDLQQALKELFKMFGFRPVKVNEKLLLLTWHCGNCRIGKQVHSGDKSECKGFDSFGNENCWKTFNPRWITPNRDVQCNPFANFLDVIGSPAVHRFDLRWFW
jgi:hypothetical protein